MSDAAAQPDTADLERVLLALSYLLTRAQEHIRTVAKADVKIGRSDVHLLMALEEGGGSCRVGDLAARLLVEASHVTRQVAQLQAQGLVERTPDPQDRRARNLTITPSGSALLTRLRRARQDSLREALDGVSASDIDATVRVLSRLIDSVARRTTE
ncbi:MULTISPECIES: MarR family winged helix-turn-helix transcriptional regulator [Streptomycetaceae]|uniref:Putative MarR-family transcriptional regulator n=1 Tax=Streptantibioticus cattleyicolor (strain ATCC 35852 / DSM 46488 / JCM 4925 / NBRC 14057 / NRRL 8057) TaxID=1003195 RepID=F8JVY9_STREN|nr:MULTISPECIES: MarR family transcriptional regulator [Streptomycetaceae]AEW92690.1 putative MarR-family transcriptional regulator [Streptantibioticus cattleyicolor NRRL 8057 = DSM 46488]MYS57460.1 MarR family transcriptional regulator [Streptomyces sp. SID5468]CCB73048.1 putative MarR-family transcriptional regulator [Streptantibioticus cattleyicolor NRRL 8057 = DSM 46488]